MEIRLMKAVLLHAEKQTDGTLQSQDTISATIQTQLKHKFLQQVLCPCKTTDLSQYINNLKLSIVSSIIC
jgi:hypothetical protein